MVRTMIRLRARIATVTVVLASLVLAGCAAAPQGPVAAPTEPASRGRLLQFTLPYLRSEPTDPNALNIARHGAAGAPLLLFLPATNAVPADYTAFLDTASRAGFSVLGLDYFNRGRSLTRTCGPDADCYGRFQRNRFDGSQPSRFSRVDAADSILTRLGAALNYLQRTDPGGDWGRFREGRRIRWSRIVVAGHSQGGGEAAFIAHYYRVRGALMFASPVETFADVSANWMQRPGLTPPSRMYGLASVNDMYYPRIIPSWDKLGMGDVGPSQAVPVPTGSQTLLTSLELGTPRQAHGRVVGDRTPRGVDGTPRLEPTWQWMLAQLR